MTTMMVGCDVNHQRIKTNGVWMHIAEKGSGPLVLLLHGFPETWFAWRRQIEFLSDHGYHAVAPDLRGYGDSDAPLTPSSYTWFHIVGDLIGLLDHFAVQQAYVVGTDWGAHAAWYLSLFRPDRVKGIVALGVPYAPRYTNVRPLQSLKQMFGDEFYLCQFQEAGRAERAFARYDCAIVMKKFMLITKPDLLIAPPRVEIVDYLETPSFLPPWITEEEIQVFADKFQESGFTGALNYYRAINLNWEILAPWQGSKIRVPAKVIVGDKDIGFESGGTREYLESTTFHNLVPDHEIVILDGHHFIHQERPQQVSSQILSFLHKLT
ncbi:alpha/beta-Hydrolases superfamily protein [Perilla frutescens var. hirtella]|uniref:soluble epoxide hydrolase n=1 Tax=Perilla frutescens var. hirtella TaxID=608512 RepID=A0AAD4NWP5_PERFH|nr:alpha/beta-Hydrolases superfamily protein [Perilla frutescens var. hirtella]